MLLLLLHGVNSRPGPRADTDYGSTPCPGKAERLSARRVGLPSQRDLCHSLLKYAWAALPSGGPNVLNISVRGRFLLAFLGISAFAVLAAAAAMWAFLELGHVVARITEERAPAALASLELSRQAERIAAAAPALLAARSEEARTKVAAGIRAQLAGVEALRARLRETATDPEALRAIESAAAGLDRNLDALDGLVAERLGAARRKEELLRR